MKKRGFTLIELLAVIVVLAIILAISIPTVTGLIENSRKKSFASSTKLVVGRALTIKSQDSNLEIESINVDNIDSILGVERNNFNFISIEKDGDEDLYATIVGQGKFAGFTSCGSEDSVTIEKTGEEVVCEVTTLCPAPTNLTPTDSSWFLFDKLTGTITGVNWQYFTSHQSDPIPLTFPTDLIIPSEIQGVKVRTIGSGAFSGQWNHGNPMNLVIPSTVKTIGYAAFSNLKIANVNIPSGVETIGTSAFQYARVSCLTLPKSLITIEPYAFYGNLLTQVSTPINLAEIGSYAFYQNQITSVKIKSGSIGFEAFMDNQINNLVFGDKVVSIGEGAFYGYSNSLIHDLLIPSKVKYVGRYAFYLGSNASINLTINADMQNIETEAFYGHYSNNLIFNSINIKNGPFNFAAFGIHNGSGVSITNLNLGSGITSIDSCAIPGGIPIDNVTINSGAIPGGAFTCGYNIKKVVIGSGVTTIGSSAFSGNQINSLTIDEGVTSIGSVAFAGNQITSVDLPSSIITLEPAAFSGNMLTSVTLPSNITTIGAAVFTNNQITSINLPSSLTSIDASAFEGNQLTSLNVPSSITDLGDNSFKTNLLAEINIMGVQDRFNPRWNLIGFPIDLMPGYNYAVCFTFDSASGSITGYNSECRKKIDIPSEINGVAVTTIGDHAFDGLGIKSVTIPNSITHIGDYAFWDDILEEDLTIPSSVTYIGEYAFSFGSNIAIDVKIDANIENTSANSFFGYTSTNVVFNNLTIAHGNILSSTFGGVKITNLKLGSGVTSIGSCAFGGGTQITNVEIANGIINDSAFSCGNGIQTLILGEGVTSIGSVAFAGNQISTLDIPSSVTSIGYAAFASNQLTTLDIPSNVITIGAGAFSSNQISSLNLHNGITTIGYMAFQDNQISNLELPISLSNVGSGAFNDNQLPNNQAIIYERSIGGIVNNNKIISYGGSNRSNINIPSGVTIIGESAFEYNDIESISIPDTVVTIESYAFSSNLLDDLTIPASLVTIDDDAFTENRLENITILGNATRFDSRWGAIGFPIALMPEGAYATSCFTFNNSTGIISGYNDECRKNVDIPNNIGGYTVNSIAEWAFYNKGITSVTVADGITTIANNAFHTNPITNATLPNTLTAINEGIFNNCQLTSITIPSNVTTIGNWAFANNSLKSITIPSNVTAIGYSSFFGNQLTNLLIPNSVISIDNTAFDSNVGLSSVNIGSGIQSIGSTTFANCPSLQTIIINATRSYVSTISGGGYASKWGSLNATLGCSGESLYSITNNDSNASVVNQGYNNDTIKLVSNRPSQPIKSFKANGSLITGSTFIMPSSSVTISEIIYESATAVLESPHPYADNSDFTLTKTMTGSTSLRVVFDAQTYVENNYDRIYVYDGSDNQIATYTSTAAAGVTLTVPGDTVKVRLTSDSSVTYYGFKCVITGL